MKLLVLDLDETLIYARDSSLERDPDFEVGPYSVYKRPGLEEFLSKVHEHFNLAVWTSSTRPYAEPVVATIFPPHISLHFVWARERCTRKFDPELHEHEWAKNLSKVKRLGYALEQVVMVDDTPAKLAQHYGNLVRIKPFFGDLSDVELAQLGSYLLTLICEPNIRAVEKRFWRKNFSSEP
jgi:TFIIF-interacting CTD phosphatase-like protein